MHGQQALVTVAHEGLQFPGAPGRPSLLEADISVRPDLGVFNAQAEDLQAELARARSSSAPQASALSAAELRVLPMLSTHLSFPEIGAPMFLSRYTVKAQATSVYRKLVSSRSQAVARARELGLLDV
jgi:LuxR family transcriptional regulator, maltose regulon positive regulatory protein